jgi:flagellar basal-body rod protein FlgF
VIYGLYQSAAGLLTTEYRQDVLANNIANADTIGFKRDVATLAERDPAATSGQRSGPSAADLSGLSGGLWLGRTYTDHSAGTMMPTGSPTDVALDGPGFLAVQGKNGTQYTRDGRMTVRLDGVLASVVDGAPMLGVGGTPILLNPRGGSISVDERGRVQQDGAVLGELQVVDFADYTALRKVGATRFAAPATTDTASAPATTAAPALLRQGYLENSSVQPVTEMVSMLEVSHAYQLNARMLTLQDDSLGRLIAATLRA